MQMTKLVEREIIRHRLSFPEHVLWALIELDAQCRVPYYHNNDGEVESIALLLLIGR